MGSSTGSQRLGDGRCEVGGEGFTEDLTLYLHVKGLDAVCETERMQKDSLERGQQEPVYVGCVEA